METTSSSQVPAPPTQSVTTPQTATGLPAGVVIHGAMRPGYETVLTPDALAFVATLVRAFAPRIASLLARRRERQAAFDRGERPDFLAETAHVRAGDWKV